MLIHNVFFWLKDSLTDQQRDQFASELKSLCEIPSARSVYVGTPSSTAKRPVIDDSFSYCLTVVFDDLSGHDEYQIHKLHQEFVANNSDKWDKLVVYDAN